MQQISDGNLISTYVHAERLDSAASVAYVGATPIQHTIGHLNCPACVRTDAMLTIDAAEFSALTLAEAVPIWKQIREQRERLRPRTHEATAGCFVALEKFFGAVRLKDITAGHLREYQIARAANVLRVEWGAIHPWKMAAGHSTINHELSALAQMMHHAGVWVRLRPYYAPLAIPSWSPRDILSEEDEARLFEKAKGHPEAQLAYWVACITNNTSAAGCELRGLRLKHLTLGDAGMADVYIPPEIVKNRNRPRRIPLNPAARWAFEQCYRRALECGSSRPDDCLFPLRICIGRWDPTQPASRSWLRKSWAHLVRIAGTPGLRPHDMRHQCITRMLEAGVDPETVRAVAGHVSPKLTEYYSHIRRQAKYAAVMAIGGRKQPCSERHVTARNGTYR